MGKKKGSRICGTQSRKEEGRSAEPGTQFGKESRQKLCDGGT